MRFSWFWPIVILLSGIATELVTRLLPGQEVTMLVTMWFLFVCPGMAFLRFFRLGTFIVEITIAVALSLSIDAAVTGIFLYAHAWNPTYTLLSLIIASALGAIGQLVFMRDSAVQVSQNDLSIVGAGKVEEAATVAVPATHIAALTRNEDLRTVANIPAFPHKGIEEISTNMLPTTVPHTPRLVEEVPTNMLPSVPTTPKQADELPTNMLPIVHNTTHGTVENMPTSMLPSVPATPRLNEDLPTNLFPSPSTDELARHKQQANQKEQAQDASHQSRKRHSRSLKKPAPFRNTDRPIEDRSTSISIKEH
jgi:hypothetical protein